MEPGDLRGSFATDPVFEHTDTRRNCMDEVGSLPNTDRCSPDSLASERGLSLVGKHAARRHGIKHHRRGGFGKRCYVVRSPDRMEVEQGGAAGDQHKFRGAGGRKRRLLGMGCGIYQYQRGVMLTSSLKCRFECMSLDSGHNRAFRLTPGGPS